MMNRISYFFRNLIYPKPHSKWHHWKRWLIFIGFLVGMILGTWGYLDYIANVRFVDAVYYALQQFLTHAPLLTGEPIPWTLEIARWVAAMTTFMAACKLFWRLLIDDHEACQIRELAGHTVICGLGDRGLAIALAISKGGRTSSRNSVLVIEKSPLPSSVNKCREAGILVLEGDATDRETLIAAGLDQAKTLIALCPDDITNSEIAAQARETLSKSKRSDTLECRIQIRDRETREAIQQVIPVTDTSSKVTLHFFDGFDPVARNLLVTGLPLDHDGIGKNDRRTVHLVILGFGRMGRTLATRAVQLGVFANGKKLRISVVDRHADRLRGEFFFRHPSVSELCYIQFYQQEAVSPDTRKMLVEWSAEPDHALSVVVCFDNDQLALELIQQIRQIANRDVRVGVRLKSEQGLARLLPKFENCLAKFVPFGMEETVNENCVLGDGEMERFAKMVHIEYGKLFNQPKERTPWRELGEDLRDSSRQMAEHIYFKVRSLGWEVADLNDPRPAEHFNDLQAESLARLEHRRWMAERVMANWKLAEKKNIERRENPNIRDWDDDKLTEAVKDYDRKLVKAIPQFLATAGKKMCHRNDPKQAVQT